MTCLLLNLEILVRDASLWCWPLTTVEWCLWSVTQWCHCYQLHHHYHHHHYILHCVVSIVPSFLAAWYFNWDVSLTLFILYLPQTHSNTPPADHLLMNGTHWTRLQWRSQFKLVTAPPTQSLKYFILLVEITEHSRSTIPFCFNIQKLMNMNNI